MKNIKIILVENDEDEQFFMKEAFEKNDVFTILAFACNGNELMTILNENDDHLPDLILSDLNMPGKNGYDILKELKADQKFAHIPIIITSTSSLKPVIDNCMKLGAAKFIQKPDTFVEYDDYVKRLALLEFESLN